MMNTWKILKTALPLLFLAAATASAQPKIAVVDMKEAFDEYWKTKELFKRYEGSKQEYLDQRQKMVDQYQAKQKEYLDLKKSAEDPAISSSEKERRNTEAEKKLQEIRKLERDIQSHQRSGETRLVEQQLRHNKNLIDEIRDVIKRKAEAEGFTLVLNTAAVDMNRTPIVLFTDGTHDITGDILSTLNQGK